MKTEKDISNSEDIKKLVNNFYVKVVADELLGPVFEEVTKTDWSIHLPKMYDFWETILFGGTYTRGNPVLRHVEVDREEKLNPEHFERWLALFNETVNEYFKGKKADEIKQRAFRIAEVIQNRININRL